MQMETVDIRVADNLVKVAPSTYSDFQIRITGQHLDS
ncbi:MAG: hypothetical protein RL077_5040 [Verrucomicrobiota bacterium]|jgi:hypothetical protein